MPAMNVKKSVVIDAPPDKIFGAINDFNHWRTWSPWLIMEPDAKVNVSEDASFYEWDGKRIGSGNMKILQTEKNKSVDYDLTFLKPWKSTSKVRFELTPEKQGTRVDWYMFGSLPFYMFWMKKMMVAFVGSDFQRGLMMLKDYVEDGEVHSTLKFEGENDFPGTKYVGLQRTCAIGNSSRGMSEDFGKLTEFFTNHQDLVSSVPFSIYHKWDMVGDIVSYTAAIPVKTMPFDVPDNFVKGEIPPTRVYTLAHTGPYHHLGNAWSTMYNLQRSKTFKLNKKIDPFEEYKNVPGKVQENDLLTNVRFPIK